MYTLTYSIIQKLLSLQNGAITMQNNISPVFKNISAD